MSRSTSRPIIASTPAPLAHDRCGATRALRGQRRRLTRRPCHHPPRCPRPPRRLRRGGQRPSEDLGAARAQLVKVLRRAAEEAEREGGVDLRHGDAARRVVAVARAELLGAERQAERGLHLVRVEVEQLLALAAHKVEGAARRPSDDAHRLAQREERAEAGGVAGVERIEAEAERQQHEHRTPAAVRLARHRLHLLPVQAAVHGHVYAQAEVGRGAGPRRGGRGSSGGSGRLGRGGRRLEGPR
eukprot:scaffold64808_cov64-Phaeocystis_antarctica.AAC.2